MSTGAGAMASPPAAAASSQGAPPAVRPGSFRAWVLASRPATLTAAVVPVMVGTAVSHALGDFNKGPAVAALLGSILIQIATNFANDVFDHEKGADTEERLGPTRAVQAGLLTPRAVRTGMLVTIALAVATGIYLTWSAGWPIVAIGVASILSGLAYTGGPYPLGYHGLGDVFVMAFFGFVAVCGTVFVETGAVPPLAILASIPVGAIATVHPRRQQPPRPPHRREGRQTHPRRPLRPPRRPRRIRPVAPRRLRRPRGPRAPPFGPSPPPPPRDPPARRAPVPPHHLAQSEVSSIHPDSIRPPRSEIVLTSRSKMRW